MLPERMLHIVFGESAGGTLRLALSQAGRGDEVLSFNDDLSFGPINTPARIVRADWAPSCIFRMRQRQHSPIHQSDFGMGCGRLKNAWCGFHGVRRASTVEFSNWFRKWVGEDTR
jgi:hypothetical protein